jgi:rhomboid protease GluP
MIFAVTIKTINKYMKGLTDKISLILKPFIIIAICFIATFTFLHWAIFIKGGVSIKEDILNFWLPFCLPYLPVYIWLRPRLNLLDFKNDNSSFGFQMIACIVIFIPTMIAQEYLITATGKITAVGNISQIEKKEKTKYYSLKNYYIDKKHIGYTNSFKVTGKYNSDFNMFIYVAMPILEKESETCDTLVQYWLGKKYSEQISNRLSENEKESKYEIFAKNTQREFDNTNFKNFKYLEVLENTDDCDEYFFAIKNSKMLKASDLIIFKPHYEPYEEKNGEKLKWIFISFAIGVFVYFIILLFPKFNENKIRNFLNGKEEKDTDIKEFFDLLIPKEGFYITPILININLLVFIAMVIAGFGFISFNGQDLLNWGANFRPSTINGQWWRPLTSIFMHGGVMHLLANMYGLLFVGVFLEPLLGKTKYLLIYLSTGILASAASICWYDATISVGASGAIFGLYGFFLATLLLKVFPPDFGKVFLISTLIFVGFNLLMGFAGGIDNAAHIGGLFSGFIFGLIMSKRLKIKIISENNKE